MGYDFPPRSGLGHIPHQVRHGYIPPLPEAGWAWFDLDWMYGPVAPGSYMNWWGMQYGLATCAVLIAWEGSKGDLSVEIPDWTKHSEMWTVSKNSTVWQYGALFSYQIGPIDRANINPRPSQRALLLGRGVTRNEGDWVGVTSTMWWPTADTLYGARLLGQAEVFDGWEHPVYYPNSAKIYNGDGDFIGDGEDPDLILNDRHPTLAWNYPGKPKPGYWGPKEPQWANGWLFTNGYPARAWERTIRTLHVVHNATNSFVSLRVGPDWVGDRTSSQIGLQGDALAAYPDHLWFDLTTGPPNWDTELVEAVSPVSEICIAVNGFSLNVNGVYRPKISDIRTAGVPLPNYQYRNEFVPTDIYADGDEYGPRDVLSLFLGASYYVQEAWPT